MAEGYSIYRFIQMITLVPISFIMIFLLANIGVKKIHIKKEMILKALIGLIFLLFVDSLGFKSYNFYYRFLFSSFYSAFELIVFTYIIFGGGNFEKNISRVLLLNILTYLPQSPSLYFFKGPYYFIGLYLIPFYLIFYLIIRRFNLRIFVDLITENKIFRRIFFIYFYISYFYMFLSPTNIVKDIEFSFKIISIPTLISIFVYYFNNRQSREMNEALLLQQESYIKSLESMQEDIRKYNHDYKNLLTGALLQAEDGDYDGVRLYLKDVLDEFEEKLGKQISKNTQLKKIKSNEVKGLLLSKMSKMEEFKIEFHLEVLNEVDRINMKTTDLVRCLGILLDNAIEEVEKLEEKVIKLVILQEEKVTTIMVKNPVTEKVNIQNIYEEGFSTKGEKRGLGLSNYKEIVENYENIVRETISTEKEFNQVLKIG